MKNLKNKDKEKGIGIDGIKNNLVEPSMPTMRKQMTISNRDFIIPGQFQPAEPQVKSYEKAEAWKQKIIQNDGVCIISSFFESLYFFKF